jgi:hypothetical protein
LKVSDVTALVYAITTLDGFRTPPLPFYKLYKTSGKNKETFIPRQADLDSSFLHSYLTRLGERDSRVNELWSLMRRDIEEFRPLQDDYDKTRRHLMLEFAGGFLFGLFVLKLVGNYLQLPNWALAVILILIALVLSRGFVATERNYANGLKEHWNGADSARLLADRLAHHLLLAARKEGRKPDSVHLMLNHDDYANLHVIKKKGTDFTVCPGPSNSTNETS